MLTHSILNIILSSSYILHLTGERASVRSVTREVESETKIEALRQKSREVSNVEEPKETRDIDKRKINIRV